MTGGSGFLGRAILRRAYREGWPAKFTIYSRDEEKQWHIRRRYPEVRCVLGDISRDLDKLIGVASGHDSIIHMGAVKFIPEAEWNILETIDVNINGSRNVATAATAAGIQTVVGISTDKACAPTNVYGMSKAIMERMFSEFARREQVNFVTVRYGNVIGSTGSVIPVFRQQIEDYGEIRITNPRMTRFWMSINEAIDLIIWAHREARNHNGHTFISQCPSMSIEELAAAVWELVDQEGTMDHKCVTIGERPGEKMHESLFSATEAPRVQFHEHKGYIMVPVTDGPVANHEYEEYSSNLSWTMKKHKMIEYIRDSESV